MKQIKFIVATLMAAVFMTISPSCSEDKDEPAAAAAKTVQGDYSGDLECSVMGSVSIFEGKTFTITATDESTVSVVLPAFGDAPMALPSITLAGVKVSEENGTVTMATTEVSGQTDTGKNYTCTISGTVQNKTFDLKFNLQYGAMPMPLICSSTAVKQ